MVDAAEVGKFGTLKLLKRHESSIAVASYPIDEEQVTFGRDRACSIRLYYQSVANLHARIIFEDRKAFLQVFGASGVIVDDCEVYPSNVATGSGDPVTVPLLNGTTFEIHQKRFQFTYPPKELRHQLFTPGRTPNLRRKSLRMSMIDSAQVFSPSPGPNPRENLRLLQSPLKLNFVREDAEEEEKETEDEPVRLVDGEHPRVLKEDQDLVILENVNPPAKPVAVPTSPSFVPSSPQRMQAPPSPLPRTPRRRSAPSLHRAVLIRSAQRAAYLQEARRQARAWHISNGNHYEEVDIDEATEVAEEEEVEEAVSSDPALFEDGEEDMIDVKEEDEEEDHGMILDGIHHAQNEDTKTNEELTNEQDITEARQQENEIEELPTPLQVARAARLSGNLGAQRSLFDRATSQSDADGGTKRTGPQRPPPGYRLSLAPTPGAGGVEAPTLVKEEEEEFSPVPGLSSSPPKARQDVSEEERRAILERRRSARMMPDTDFADHAPGLGHRRKSALPSQGPASPSSPFKSIRRDIDEGEDTRSVLKRMEMSLAEMRRRSMANALIGLERPNFDSTTEKEVPRPPSPKKMFSLLSPGPSAASVRGLMSRLLGSDGGSKLDGISDNTGSFNVDVDCGETQVHEVTAPSKQSHSQATPRMDGLREMFRAPNDAPTGLTTPVVHGVRELFREKPSDVAETPLMDGVRIMFSERQAPGTPAFDGIEEMMRSGEGLAGGNGGKAAADVPMDTSGDAEIQVSTPVLRSERKRTGRSKFMPKETADLSTMADGKNSPDLPDVERKLAGPPGIPSAEVVHRNSRARRATREQQDDADVAHANDDNVDSADVKSKTTRRGQVSRSRSNASEFEFEDAVAAVGTQEAVRGSTKISTRTKQGRLGVTSDSDSSAATKEPITRRRTRARSRGADPDGDSNADTGSRCDASEQSATDNERTGRMTPGARGKRGARKKAAAIVEIGPIPEEATPEHGSPGLAIFPLRIAAARTRRTRSDDTEDSAAAAPSKKSSRSKTDSAETRLGEEDTGVSRKGDKENTPEPSIVSSGESSEDGAAAAAKTGGISTSASRPKDVVSSKTPRRKAVTEKEELTPRSTRARGRK